MNASFSIGGNAYDVIETDTDERRSAKEIHVNLIGEHDDVDIYFDVDFASKVYALLGQALQERGK